MKVRDIMTRSPACCTATTPLEQVSRLMVACDCGGIPVCDELGRPIGIITDRDITCRAVAAGKNPLEMTAGQCMSSPCVTCQEGDDVGECARTLEAHMVRRAPVVDADGVLRGIVAQADFARFASESQTAQLVREVSRPAQSASSFI